MLAIVGLLFLGLEILLAMHWRVNSDEPQHLHVVWGWTQGLLPYRDLFDNHTPLFQLLSAPLLWLLGERQDILVWMRTGELPFYALALYCIWRIGRALFDRSVAWLSCLGTALHPWFATRMIEFRPDGAWAATWLLAVMVAVEGRVTPRRTLMVGLITGVAIALSMKSILLIGCFLFGLALVWSIQAMAGERPWPRPTAAAVLAGFSGLILVPLALAVFFAAHGAWQDLLYGVFMHNLVPGLGRWDARPWHVWILPALTPFLYLLARRVLRTGDPALGARRAAVLLWALVYWIALLGYWPLLSKQDFLPLLPVLMVFASAALLAAFGAARLRRFAPIVLLAVGAEAVSMLADAMPWKDRESAFDDTLATVLALTSPTDIVFDCKGESVYRTRASRLVLEGVTQRRLQLGSMQDDIVAGLRHAPLAISECHGIPQRAKAFLDHNYLPIGNRVAVAGTRLTTVPAATAVDFDVGVATSYVALTERGGFDGSIDGTPYTDPRLLASGRHTLSSARAEPSVELIWARAAERGFRAVGPSTPPQSPARR